MSISIFMPGHNNWYQITRPPEDFKITLNPYKFNKMKLQDAEDYTAQLVYSKYKNIWLSLSGGTDSEYVANILYRNKIPFTPIIWRDKLNPEADFALHWCRSNKVNPFVLEKNLLDKKTKQTLTLIAEKLQSSNILMTFSVETALTAAKNNGKIIVATGECFGDTDYPAVMDDSAVFQERDFVLEQQFNGQHPGAFLCYTPELLYALITNIDTSLPIQEAKTKLYNIPFRPKMRPYHFITNVTLKQPNRKEHYSFGTLKDLKIILEEFCNN